jgi:hypothetical protein
MARLTAFALSCYKCLPWLRRHRDLPSPGNRPRAEVSVADIARLFLAFQGNADARESPLPAARPLPLYTRCRYTPAAVMHPFPLCTCFRYAMFVRNVRLLKLSPGAGLSVIRSLYLLRYRFREKIFYREDFVYLYDELFTSGKITSRSWSLQPSDMPCLRLYIPFRRWRAIAATTQ